MFFYVYKCDTKPTIFLVYFSSLYFTEYLIKCNDRLTLIFALKSFLQGIDVLTDILIKQPEMIQSVKQSGLVVFCWGEENNNTETINTLKQSGIDAIIYDK